MDDETLPPKNVEQRKAGSWKLMSIPRPNVEQRSRPWKGMVVVAAIVGGLLLLKHLSSGNKLNWWLYAEHRTARELRNLGADVDISSDHKITRVEFESAPATDGALELMRDLEALQALRMNLSLSFDQNEDPNRPPRLPKFQPWNARPCKVTDAGLRHLRELTSLEEVSLVTNLSVTPSGLSVFRNLRSLKRLHIESLSVTDLGCFEELTELEELYLKGRHYAAPRWSHNDLNHAADNLKAFRNARSLKRVCLETPLATEAGLRAMLEDKPELEVLHLEGTYVTDAALKALEGAPNLRSLYVQGPVTDAGLQHLRGLAKLRHLVVYHNFSREDVDFGDAGLQHLAGLPELRYLSISNTEITDAGLENLGELKELRYLVLDGAEITGSGFGAIRYLPKLTYLDLGGPITDDTSRISPVRQPWNISSSIVAHPFPVPRQRHCLIDSQNCASSRIGGGPVRGSLGTASSD